jgi:thiamine pyrophosphate-dependent acetolactate synthase large subunit-like protein
MAITRREAVEALIDVKGEGISVATMQAGKPWAEVGGSEGLNLNVVGCMGAASTWALGVALARPDKRLMVLDGDGSLLMQLGSLVTIGAQSPANFYHFVFENGTYGTSGNQPMPGQTHDFCALAKAAGYKASFSFTEAPELRAGLPEVLATPGPVLIRLVIEPEHTELTGNGVFDTAAQVQKLKAALARDRR